MMIYTNFIFINPYTGFEYISYVPLFSYENINHSFGYLVKMDNVYNINMNIFSFLLDALANAETKYTYYDNDLYDYKFMLYSLQSSINFMHNCNLLMDQMIKNICMINQTLPHPVYIDANLYEEFNELCTIKDFMFLEKELILNRYFIISNLKKYYLLMKKLDIIHQKLKVQLKIIMIEYLVKHD